MKVAKKYNGFTLIEIVVVIAIMGVLTVIIYSSFDASKAQSRDQKRVSDISAIQIALEQFFQKNGKYPLTLTELTTAGLISVIPIDTTNNYNNNYFPITKMDGTDKCISYQLWARFERNNSYLDSKRGFNSYSGLPSKMFECGVTKGLHESAKINASNEPLIYDVMP